MFTWIEGSNNLGTANVASRASRIATNASSLTPSAGILLGRRLASHKLLFKRTFAVLVITGDIYVAIKAT